MSILFTNNAATTLASGITNVATSLTVASGKGALFPTITGADYFYATLANTSGSVEIVKVTARSTDTFTIVRGQDGTSGLAWNTGDKVELRVTAADLTAMAQTANNLSDLANASTARTILGLGTIATQASSSVNITGGSVTGITDLAVADGGTGASTAANARTNLGLVIGTDVLAPNGSAASLTSFPTFNQNTTGSAATVAGNATGSTFGFNSGYGSVATAYGCRSWVNFNGTGTVAIRASGNVSSITDNGTGDYTVNFSTGMPDANYGCFGWTTGFSTGDPSRHTIIYGSLGSGAAGKTTSGLRVQSAAADANVFGDAAEMNVSIFR
jgi:hypothetical protein